MLVSAGTNNFSTHTMSELTWEDFAWEAELEGLSELKSDLTLNPDTDPFNIAGAPLRFVSWGRWFADLFHRFYGTDSAALVHLRRIHYRLVSNETPLAMVGSVDQRYAISPIWVVPNRKTRKGERPGDERPNVYVNTLDCWARLCKAAKWARWLELIDGDRIIDNRSPEPVFFDWDAQLNPPQIAPAWAINHHSFEPSEFEVDSLWLPDAPSRPTLSISGIRPHARRYSHYIEVWVEKSTMNDILVPICERYGVTLQTGVGEMSMTRVRKMIERITQLGRPARIFYLSDFDPGGLSMPLSVARKTEYAIRCDHPEMDVQLVPIALSREQVAQFNLPTIPIKESESRAGKFLERQDVDGAVELDALEALHPGALSEMVHEAIRPYRDADSRWSDALDALENDLRRRAVSVNEQNEERFGEVISELQDEFQVLCEETEAEYDDLDARFTNRVAAWIKRAQPVYEEAKAHLEDNRPTIEEGIIPGPDLVREDDPLMDSDFTYIQQMRRYRRHTGRKNVDDLLDDELDYR